MMEKQIKKQTVAVTSNINTTGCAQCKVDTKIYQTIPKSSKYKYKYWDSSDPVCCVLKGKNTFPVSFVERDAA